MKSAILACTLAGLIATAGIAAAEATPNDPYTFKWDGGALGKYYVQCKPEVKVWKESNGFDDDPATAAVEPELQTRAWIDDQRYAHQPDTLIQKAAIPQALQQLINQLC